MATPIPVPLYPVGSVVIAKIGLSHYAECTIAGFAKPPNQNTHYTVVYTDQSIMCSSSCLPANVPVADIYETWTDVAEAEGSV